MQLFFPLCVHVDADVKSSIGACDASMLVSYTLIHLTQKQQLKMNPLSISLSTRAGLDLAALARKARHSSPQLLPQAPWGGS